MRRAESELDHLVKISSEKEEAAKEVLDDLKDQRNSYKRALAQELLPFVQKPKLLEDLENLREAVISVRNLSAGLSEGMAAVDQLLDDLSKKRKEREGTDLFKRFKECME